MQHPPPPPPISSVFVRSQHATTERRSMTSTGTTENIYEDNDDDSVSSCSMEVMSVNAPYAYYNHCIVEASSQQPRLRSSYTNSTMAGYSCGDSEDDEEETSTADSTGSFDHQACLIYCNDPETRRPNRTQRRSQRKSQPQQMARILACSSPEITALCKSSFRLPNESSRPRLQQQVSSDMMSIGSSDTNDNALETASPDVRMESTSMKKTLFLPPRCPPTTMLFQEQTTTQESSPSPVRADHQSSLPPMWTDVWLRDSRDAMAEVPAEMIPSSSSDTDDPHASFRSSSYPMHHFSDSCIGPTSTSRSLRYHSNSPPPIVTRKSHTTTSTSPPIDHDLGVAIVLDPLSKLSLHRRVSYDQLPSWKEIGVAVTTTANRDSNHDHTLNDASNRNSKLEKLVLHKTVTVVSDETMR